MDDKDDKPLFDREKFNYLYGLGRYRYNRSMALSPLLSEQCQFCTSKDHLTVNLSLVSPWKVLCAECRSYLSNKRAKDAGLLMVRDANTAEQLTPGDQKFLKDLGISYEENQDNK